MRWRYLNKLTNKNKKHVKKVNVFISYRRLTGRDIARNIYERLTLKGISAFFDYNSIRNGKFNTQIYTAIEQADDFILILSEGALDRCNHPDDWVRMELELALKLKKNIIILSTSNNIIFPENLPESLKELKYYQGITLNQEYYEESINRLLSRLTWNSKDKRKFRIIFFGITIIMAGGFLIYFYFVHPHPQNIITNKVSARLYLPRYEDINYKLLNENYFTSNLLDIFSYIDLYENENYLIAPKSKFLTLSNSDSINLNFNTSGFHDLPLRLRLQNSGNNTIVFNKARIEFFDFTSFNIPVVSLQTKGNVLKIIKENGEEPFKIHLELREFNNNSTFLNNFTQLNIIEDDFSYNLSTDIFQGKIEILGKKWFFDSKNLNKDTLKTPHKIKIEPLNSDIFYEIISVTENKSEQVYYISNFNRKLMKGSEIDDNIFFIITAPFSFKAKMRIVLETPQNKTIFSNCIQINYFMPNSLKNASL